MGGYHTAESAGSKRRAAWRDDTAEVHTDKLVSRDLCSVADLPGSRISAHMSGDRTLTREICCL